MRTRVERRGDKVLTICEIEDFDRDVIELVEMLKARRYKLPFKVIIVE